MLRQTTEMITLSRICLAQLLVDRASADNFNDRAREQLEISCDWLRTAYLDAAATLVGEPTLLAYKIG